MCLVISVLLFALSANFFLNGFFLQAGLSSAVAVGLIVLLIKNVKCRQNRCGLNLNKDSTAKKHNDLNQEIQIR